MCWARLNFYPRPPRGGRHSQHRGLCLHRGISIHALREEGDTARNRRRNLPRRFLSTPSARRATRAPRAAQRLRPISIHALREEGDQTSSRRLQTFWYFYPRPPRGGRPFSFFAAGCSGQFLSTPSARRATKDRSGLLHQIHLFLSTPSARRATPRASRPAREPTDFYPRPPRGGRQACTFTRTTTSLFLSTPSARRATTSTTTACRTITDFYPRPPRGGRPWLRQPERHEQAISIHALREEGDQAGLVSLPDIWISIHALREEGDLVRSL